MGQGSGTSFGGFGSVDTGIPEPYGVDPSIAPGLPRMEGWRVVLPDGSAAWDKTGPLDTDWTLVAPGAGGDVTALVAGDAGIVLTNPGGPVVTVGQIVAAEWPIANMRIYAVDFVNGLDTNAGFADAAGTSSANYAAACVAAGAVAKKTIAGLAAIFPRVGNGRLVEIIIANGGVNTEQSYAESLALVLNGSTGYAANGFGVRGTGTNTTAGAVAFAGTTNDLDYQGAITATGCNSAGYNPTGAPTTTSIQCLKVGGGAAAIPAEPAAPLGWRIRFDNATTTAALRNVCRSVAQVSGTDTVLPQTALPAVPVAGDIFYLEQAGVAIPAMTLDGVGQGVVPGLAVLSGLRSTGAITHSSSQIRWAFCGAASFSANGPSVCFVGQTWTHPVLGARTIGGGFRSEATIVVASIVQGSMTGAISVGVTNFSFTPSVTWGAGCYAGAGLGIRSCHANTSNTGSVSPTIGTTAATGIPRVKGGLILSGTHALAANVVSDAAGAAGAVQLQDASVLLCGGTISGTTGNTGAGIDLSAGRGSLIVLVTTPTVTGTAGDMKLAGGQFLTWAQAAATGIVDTAGNRILGTAGVPPQGMETKSGVLLSDITGAKFTYIADENPTSLGALLVINNIVPVRWPTSLRVMTRLRACYLQPDPATKDIVVTLYKNNVATAMTVTITNGSAVGTKFVDVAHPILFQDGDDWSVRLDVGQAGAEGATAYAVGVTLEWAA